MSVTLARIDDRLIHGQIVHAWIEYSKAKHLLIADDFASTDKTSQLMLRLAAPETKSQGLFHQIQEEVTFCGLLHEAYA